ncbi:MAG: hypothetical protein ACRELE_02240 [Gemmatimonadales bacterium]
MHDLDGVGDRLPALIRFGTSTWTYPGWKRLACSRDNPPAELNPNLFGKEVLGRLPQRYIPAYVTVDNRVEGCAPLTISAVAHLLGNSTPSPDRRVS